MVEHVLRSRKSADGTVAYLRKHQVVNILQIVHSRCLLRCNGFGLLQLSGIIFSVDTAEEVARLSPMTCMSAAVAADVSDEFCELWIVENSSVCNFGRFQLGIGL